MLPPKQTLQAKRLPLKRLSCKHPVIYRSWIKKLNQLSVSVQESEDQIRSGFESVLSTLKDQKNERIARHKRQLKLKSRNVIMAFVFLFLLFTVSLIGNIYQRNELTRVSDNDLKYRYIKMVGGINAEELSKLEDIFHYDKDKELIREIRKRMGKYESKMDQENED
jgi:uncharacterized protein YerC